MKNKTHIVDENGDVTHTEIYSSFKEVREKYGINGGWCEIAQGRMGHWTNCNKRVIKDDFYKKKSTYTVYWTERAPINFGPIPCILA